MGSRFTVTPNICRFRHQVHISLGNTYVALIATPVGKAWKARIRANMGLTIAALLTDAIALAEPHQNAITLAEASHLFAHLFDNAAELMAHHQRHRRHQPDPAPIARPSMPIRPTDTLGL